MIIETYLENNRIERHSDKDVYIFNTVTECEYESAIDFTNEERVRRGLVPYTYIETDRRIERPVEPDESKEEPENI